MDTKGTQRQQQCHEAKEYNSSFLFVTCQGINVYIYFYNIDYTFLRFLHNVIKITTSLTKSTGFPLNFRIKMGRLPSNILSFHLPHDVVPAAVAVV